MPLYIYVYTCSTCAHMCQGSGLRAPPPNAMPPEAWTAEGVVWTGASSGPGNLSFSKGRLASGVLQSCCSRNVWISLRMSQASKASKVSSPAR